MLRKARDFFSQLIQSSPEPQGESEHTLRLATAALFIEMTRADHAVDEQEKKVVVESLRQLFDLSQSEAHQLARLAEEEADGAVSLYQYTQLINERFELQQKIRVIEMLWRIAFADEYKDKHEEYLVRKVADLIHVKHRDFIRARHRIEKQLQATDRSGLSS